MNDDLFSGSIQPANNGIGRSMTRKRQGTMKGVNMQGDGAIELGGLPKSKTLRRKSVFVPKKNGGDSLSPK